MKAYQAWGPAGKVTGDTPANAATLYFQKFPRARKCDVTEGEDDGVFFTVTYGRKSDGQWPRSWKNVTKKMASTLGD